MCEPEFSRFRSNSPEGSGMDGFALRVFFDLCVLCLIGSCGVRLALCTAVMLTPPCHRRSAPLTNDGSGAH